MSARIPFTTVMGSQPTMLQTDQWNSLLELFQVPQQPIFVLGCFARHVTVYSQQVRALNLIAAMKRAGYFKYAPEVAVIGAGAAGLMAAAAAAHSGARVTLLEQLDGPMELQRGSYQRWLHPHIYDWPFTELKGSEAGLPLLTWHAGYASDVAEQIEGWWGRFLRKSKREGFRGSIESKWSVTDVAVIMDGNGLPYVTWGGDENGGKAFSCVILSVGFGIEPTTAFTHSYWADDDLDLSHRPLREMPQWFVSGVGDGGLTDTMRLCFRHFRHKDVLDLFVSVGGIGQLKTKLIGIHPPDRDPSAQWVDDEFKRIMGLNNSDRAPNPWNELAKNLEKEGVLRGGPQVRLGAETRFIYGPRSSILNRLIISQLDRQKRIRLLPQARFLMAPAEGITFDGRQYTVSVEHRTSFSVDRIILRHGPKPALAAFPAIYQATEELRNKWKYKGINRDETRERHWDPGEFGPENLSGPLLQAGSELGVEVIAKLLSATKEVRNDGSSLLRYEIRGLTALKTKIAGLRVSASLTSGYLGAPILDADAIRHKMSWVPDEASTISTEGLSIEGVRRSLSSISGTIRFEEPIEPGDAAFSFGFAISVINGDSLSAWEFDQMTEPSSTQTNGSPPVRREYIARYIWLHAEELSITVSLPPEVTSVPTVRLKNCGKSLSYEDIIKDDVLQMAPSLESPLHPSSITWQEESEAVGGTALGYLKRVSSQSWNLWVPKPLIGSLYSLRWELPERPIGPRGQQLVYETNGMRDLLLRHGVQLRQGLPGDQLFSSRFIKLAESLRHRFRDKGHSDESFEVSLMTYDESQRRLITVETNISGENCMAKSNGETWLHFGLGLAGTAFKECGKLHLYKRSERSDIFHPSPYVPLEHSVPHEVLLSIPLEHPEVWKLDSEDTLFRELDRSRACLGVLNIGSSSRLSTLNQSSNDIDGLRLKARTQNLAAKLLQQFMLSISEAV